MEEFYIHLSSEDSKDLYPHNTPADFRVQLPERIQLLGRWKCALAEIKFVSPTQRSTLDTSLLLNSNLCDSSIVGNTKAPILRRMPLTRGTYNKTYDFLHYYPIKTFNFDTIHLYINTDTGERASFIRGPLKATLHFRRTE